MTLTEVYKALMKNGDFKKFKDWFDKYMGPNGLYTKSLQANEDAMSANASASASSEDGESTSAAAESSTSRLSDVV